MDATVLPVIPDCCCCLLLFLMHHLLLTILFSEYLLIKFAISVAHLLIP